MIAQADTIEALDIANLIFDKNHISYSDGVACVQAYWTHALNLSEDERRVMSTLAIPADTKEI